MSRATCGQGIGMNQRNPTRRDTERSSGPVRPHDPEWTLNDDTTDIKTVGLPEVLRL